MTKEQVFSQLKGNSRETRFKEEITATSGNDMKGRGRFDHTSILIELAKRH